MGNPKVGDRFRIKTISVDYIEEITEISKTIVYSKILKKFKDCPTETTAHIDFYTNPPANVSLLKINHYNTKLGRILYK